MKKSYINIVREPDDVLFRYDDSGIRFEEPDSREEQVSRVGFEVIGDALRVRLYPSEKAYRHVRIRWNGDLSDVTNVYGDDWARYINETPWSGVTPQAILPWYVHAYDGERLSSFGVKTGPDAFCAFSLDQYGITLWIDVKNGGAGVVLSEPLDVCDIICDEGIIGEDPFVSAEKFCARMCEKPVALDQPLFGVNNWYWAYGNISHDSIMVETDQLMDMCRDTTAKPYMILDDGWQVNRFKSKTGSYNGGPWDRPNEKFTDMAETAAAINEKGAHAGIWFRPLLTCVSAPDDATSPYAYKGSGFLLDPTHPWTLEKVASDTAMIAGWGYKLLKHDFTTYDSLGNAPGGEGNWHFYDKSVTNCTMLKRLYKTIQDASNGAVIIGCNTINHLTAGIYAVQRSGGDTSGRSFEITRRNGVKSMVRQPQNKTFFAVDPDCAAFTDRVDHDLNLDFLEMAAVTGVVTLASVTPGSLTPDEMKRIRAIYKIASEGGLGATPEKWVGVNQPSHFITPDGKRFAYDWFRGYNGSRRFYSWMN